VGHPDVTGYQEGGNDRGSETSGVTEGNSRGEVRTSIEELRDHLRSRPATGIPGHREVDPSEILLQAFLDGNFEVALIAAQELQAAYRESLLEAGKLRFKLNFGTSTCDNCEGLKAGPGVAATCFQIRRCEFQNVLEESASPRQVRILRKMTAE
jgi:hypothetical protein